MIVIYKPRVANLALQTFFAFGMQILFSNVSLNVIPLVLRCMSSKFMIANFKTLVESHKPRIVNIYPRFIVKTKVSNLKTSI